MTILLILFIPLLLLLLLDSLLRAWFVLVNLWPGPIPSTIPDSTACNLAVIPDSTACNLAVVIPAHDEAVVIGETVARLRQWVPAEAMFVIADNCTDDTAAVARRAGARAWERRDQFERGKGAALRWFFSTAQVDLQPFDGLAIFDADSWVDEQFLRYASTMMAQGTDVIQGLVQPISGGALTADLAAYSELISQYIDDTARTRLGWPGPMRGTGMVFRRDVFQTLLPHLRTKLEDAELSLLLAAGNRQVSFVRQAVIRDPKPSNVQGVASQRARWLQGQREVWRYHGRLISRMVWSGRLSLISLLLAILFKPKTFIFALKGAFFGLFLTLPGLTTGLRWGLVGISGLALGLDLIYYIAGLWFVETPGRYARALALSPFYLVMWLWSLALSVISRQPWLKVRRTR